MNLYYFRGQKPNFGDELNAWLWPKILDGVWNDLDNSIFLGIGSIIYDSFPIEKKKIVFGAGYGGYTPLPVIDHNWKFYFVRGKLTAKALGIDESLGIGDAAILLRSCVKRQVKKRYKVSFMPHWESTLFGNWELACQKASINYINPCADVEAVLEDILASELVITEAMHGAIVSDALRVPWIPVQPLNGKHSMKWYDWASALDINLNPISLTSSSLRELTVNFFDQRNPHVADQIRRRGNFLSNVAPYYLAERASLKLINISKTKSYLSTDAAIARSHAQMLSKLDELVQDLGFGKIIL